MLLQHLSHIKVSRLYVDIKSWLTTNQESLFFTHKFNQISDCALGHYRHSCYQASRWQYLLVEIFLNMFVFCSCKLINQTISLHIYESLIYSNPVSMLSKKIARAHVSFSLFPFCTIFYTILSKHKSLSNLSLTCPVFMNKSAQIIHLTRW